MKIQQFKTPEALAKAYQDQEPGDRKRFIGAIIQRGGDQAVWAARVVAKDRPSTTDQDAPNNKIGGAAQKKGTKGAK
jgi:hypothetical protein